MQKGCGIHCDPFEHEHVNTSTPSLESGWAKNQCCASTRKRFLEVAKMSRSTRRHLSLAAILIIVIFLAPEASPASGDLLVAYGGHNETMAPMWVGVDRGLFKKHGVDPRVLQTRSGPIMMATLASGGAPLV